MNNSTGEIIIYIAPNKEIELEVRLQQETVWLNQLQISTLFSTDRSVITKHLSNIFKTGELDEKSNVQKMHIGSSDKPVKFYSLNAIISVGYRVNSVRATKFRIWATKTLKDYLVKGFIINEKHLLGVQNKFQELKSAISLIENKSKKEQLYGHESEILSLLVNYSNTLTILGEYDEGRITDIKGKITKFILTYERCLEIISELKKELILKKETGDLFGNERGREFETVVKNLYQTFEGKELYPSIEDKASNLLYLIIKDHPFSDGNKRTAVFLFVYFLDKVGSLYRITGEKKINDNALTALALLVAESDPEEKYIMIKIIKNLIAN